MKPIRYILEYGLFLLAHQVVRPLSATTVYRLGKNLGLLLYRLSGKRQRVARINLDIAFGDEKSHAEKTQILKQCAIQHSVSLLQFLWVAHNPEKRAKELIEGEPEGLDVVQECLGRGKGILFLTAHYGNWEVMGVNHGLENVGKLVSIARMLDNPYLERFVLRVRTCTGNRILYRDENPIKLVRALKNNECLAVMMDQNAGDWGTFVDFFGKHASTARALPLLSYKHGTPILPMFCFPVGDGKYRIVYGPELRLKKSGNKDDDVVAWTAACLKHLEWVIKQQPEPWLWFHRRWKSRPEGEARNSVYGV